jgi:hypothetical protein
VIKIYRRECSARKRQNAEHKPSAQPAAYLHTIAPGPAFYTREDLSCVWVCTPKEKRKQIPIETRKETREVREPNRKMSTTPVKDIENK